MSLVIYHDTYACQSEKPIAKLVMLHGWGMNSLVWDDLIPLLIPHYEITIIDLPGMGRSPLPEGDYTIDFLVNKVLEVAPDKAIWFGWSLGALVVQKIALDFPKKIERAFLIAGTPKFVANESWPLAMPLTVFEKFQSLLAEDWQGTLIRFLTLQCKGSETIKEDTRKLREYLFHYGLPATKALREGLSVLKEVDFRSDLATLSVPIIFISGEYDTLVPAQVLADIKKLNAHISVHLVKGASHAAHISHAKEVADIFYKTILDEENLA
jgi:pimeloyl-[acyl-carrier protein] methyl ester esterase